MVTLLEGLKGTKESLLRGGFALADDRRDLGNSQPTGEAKHQQLARLGVELPEEDTQPSHLLAPQQARIGIVRREWLQRLRQQIPGDRHAAPAVRVYRGVA